MDFAWMLVVLVLYGAGMYLCGYRKALKKAMDDLQEMADDMLKGEEHERSDKQKTSHSEND